MDISCNYYTTDKEKEFFENLLFNISCPLSSVGTSASKRIRLINFLVTLAHSQKSNNIILFIDEAQFLREAHLNWLLDIHNQLNRESIRLTSVLVGTNELKTLKSGMKLSKKLQIIRCFMISENELNGISNLNEFIHLHECF
jgi:type II secretory pathway predicted ATPase ExeA